MQPYHPRPIRFLGVRDHAGWRVKHYTIAYGEGPVDEARFAPGLRLALASLPVPAETAGRPGVAFVVAHRGRGADYVVLGWWDRENELPVRIFLREQGAAIATWRPARGGESFCVWDLQVMWFEREAYVRTVLGERGAAACDEYLALALDVGVRDPAPWTAGAAGGEARA